MTKQYSVDHSLLFSPSSLARRIACRGSGEMEANSPAEGPKPAADWGTFAHDISAHCLKLGMVASTFLGDEKYGQVCDQEMVDCVNDYLEHIEELKQMVPNAAIAIEERVDLGHHGYPQVFGTADLILDEIGGSLLVCDLKSGAGVPVSPEANAQLYTYALMAAGRAIDQYEKIVIAISQPRAKTGGRALKVHELMPEELLAWFGDVLEPTIKAIESGDKTLNAGEEQCRFCRATNQCPEFTKRATDLAKVDFADINPVPPVVNDELVARVYPHLSMLKSWIKAVEGHAFSMADTGSLPGFKLVTGRRSRDWRDKAKAVEVLKEHGVDPFEHKLLSPAKAEKVLGKGKAVIKGLITVSEGKPVITHEHDRRQAITSAAMDFANIS